METIALIAFAVFALTDWFAVARGNRNLEYVAKPAALAALVVYAACGPRQSIALIAALSLGLLGDVYLMLPQDLFVAGLGAFLVGHIAYISDFVAPFSARVLWFVVLLAAAFPVARRILSAIGKVELQGAVVVYLGTITFMAASAIASGSASAAFGAILFMVSDTLIAWNRFVTPLSWGRLAVIITYHVGQFGLAYGLR